MPGAAGDAFGGVTYAAFAYLVIAICWPGLRPARVALAAFAFSAAVELLQWTGAAADLVDVWPPLRVALGTSFVATDFAAYAVGAALAAAVDRRRVASA